MDRKRLGVRFNKRGQVFSAILVVITLLMCSISIIVYLKQQGEVHSSLVSPLAVLEVRDALDIFEMREQELILKSLKGVNSDFGSEKFGEEFKANFLSGIDEKMKGFIFSNLIVEGRAVARGDKEDMVLKNIVYEDAVSYVDSSELRFKRSEIGKAFELEALDLTEKNFVVDFSFDFSAEYSIKKVNGKFVVEKV